jgi:hypothetical protein
MAGVKTASVAQLEHQIVYNDAELRGKLEFIAWRPNHSLMDIAFTEENDEAKKHADAVKAVFAKHGITEKMLKDDPKPGGSPEDAMTDLIKPIKDRVAFVADMGKVNGKKFQNFPIKGGTKLSDVKEDGDTAKGTMTFKILDNDKTDTVDFKKVDGSWGIELTDGP